MKVLAQVVEKFSRLFQFLFAKRIATPVVYYHSSYYHSTPTGPYVKNNGVKLIRG